MSASPKSAAKISWALILLAVAFFAGCSKDEIGVTVTPATASISTFQTQQFAATVDNSNNPAVTWLVDGFQGGHAGVGLISDGGLYTPPPAAGTHAITAISNADPSKSGSASITVTLSSQIEVTVTPATASISTLQTQQFTATVVNSTNPAVTWRVDGVLGGNAAVGRISAAGLYTPPSTAGPHSITATSVADPTKSGSASLSVTLPVPGVTVTPAVASISTIQTQQFTATVVNIANTSVTWRVDGVQGGNATVGRISAAGLYTPPLTAGPHTITAASVGDPTKSDSATVTVTLIGVTVAPATASISRLQTQQFTATVVNSTNPAVTWRVDGVQGGNAGVGAITAGGLYTPSPTTTTGAHTITATSVADPTRSGNATVTVTSIGVTVAPAAASISTIQAQQFTATVVNSTNTAVTWRVDGVQGGNATVGVISSGLYTPSPAEATHSITATSVADPTASGTASVTVTLPVLPVGVTVTPATLSISTIQTQQFTATVVNSTNTAVTWRVDGVQGGNITVGVISAAGLYTPSPREATRSITATSVADPTKSGSASVTVKFLSGVLTYHNDNARTGQNLQETVLTPANVKSATFGKLFSFPVDGYVYAQPLYVSNVPMNGQLRNVAFVATEHNSVYAFDADNQTSAPLWQVSFVDPPNITTVPFEDTASPPGYTGPGPVIPGGCGDLTPEIGITGTPVIDPATGTLYVVAKTKERSGANVTYEHRLHALDITTGISRAGSGRALQASVPGTTLPNDNGRVLFQSLRQNQRAALLLNNGVVTVAFSSHCTIRPYQGWALTYDATTLDPLGAFNVAPNDPKGKGGIWHSGGGPAADASGNVFVMTGDGPFDAASGGNSYSDSVLKLTNGSLTVSDYFTPFNQLELEAANADMSSGGPLLLPDQSVGPPRLMVSAGKQGVAYLLNRDNMGRFQAGSDSQIVQSFTWGVCAAGAKCLIFGTPAYFNNTVYMAAVDDGLKAYSLAAGRLSLSGQSVNTFPWPGSTPVVSANGANNGIVWALETSGLGASALLHAYSAADVSIELYNSNQNPQRDSPGPPVKFTVPTVANGKVYVGAQGRLSVFGLLP